MFIKFLLQPNHYHVLIFIIKYCESQGQKYITLDELRILLLLSSSNVKNTAFVGDGCQGVWWRSPWTPVAKRKLPVTGAAQNQ